MPRCRRCS
ncbi:hypothetical protein VCHE40_3620, partial [Vibrio cholerae HE-40]